MECSKLAPQIGPLRLRVASLRVTKKIATSALWPPRNDGLKWIPAFAGMTLLRHSDIRLTMSVYSHSYRESLVGAIEQLPDLSVQVLEQTGTDEKSLVHSLGQYLDKNITQDCTTSQRIAETKQGDKGRKAALASQKPRFSNRGHGSDKSCEKWRRGDSNPRPVMFQDKRLHV